MSSSSAETKKRKRYAAPSRRLIPVPPENKEPTTVIMNQTMAHAAEASDVHIRIQQAKNFAVAQAQQEGCTSNFKIFDSLYGNFLVPVIPTRAELGG